MVSVYFLYHFLMRSKGTPRIRFAASLFQRWFRSKIGCITRIFRVLYGAMFELVYLGVLFQRNSTPVPYVRYNWQVFWAHDPVSIAFSFCDFLSYTCLIHIFLLRFSAAVTRRTGNGSCSGWSELFWWNSTGSSANSSNGHAINNSGPQKARYYY